LKALVVLIITLGLVYLVAEIAKEPVLPDASRSSESGEIRGDKLPRLVETVSIHCEQNSSHYNAMIKLRNLTSSEISYAKIFVHFNPKGRLPFEQTVDLSPAVIPAHGVVQVELISRTNEGRSYDCAVVQVMDSGGDRMD
jgi:hypothetical protein